MGRWWRRIVGWSAACVTLPFLLGGAPARDGVRVAALQYSGDAATVDARCAADDAVCGLTHLVRKAHAQGARIVVAPEYALQGGEPDPEVGEPVSRGQLGIVSATAAELEIYIVVNLLTHADGKRFNALIAFGPDGAVVARHHKFELYAGEKDDLTPGDEITFFSTPFARVALIVCADIYADPAFHERLAEEGADIVLVSSQWTVADAQRWQAAFARDWNVFVVAANSSTGDGRGGGVFDPTGKALGRGHASQNDVVVADLDLSDR